MPTYIGKDGIRVLVLPQTPEEIAEGERKWREYLRTPYIKALRQMAGVEKRDEPQNERKIP